MVLGTRYTPIENQNTRVVNIESGREGFYEVQKGDTLYSISKKYNVLVEDLKRKNNLPNNTLSIGQMLKVN